MSYTYLLNVCDITTPMLLLGMLIPALLGYLLRHFMGGKTTNNTKPNLTDDWSNKYAKLQADYSSLQSKYSASSGASINAGNLEGKIKKLQGNMSSYEGDIKKLRADLETANMKLKGFANVDVEDLQLKIKSLEANNSKLQTSITSLSGSASSLEETQQQAEALKNKLHQLETDNAHLKSSLDRSEAERKNIVRSEENLTRYKEDVRELSGKVGAYKIETDRLKQEIANLKGQGIVAQSDSKTVITNTTESSTNQETNTLQQQVADALKTNRDISEELAHVKGQLKVIQSNDKDADATQNDNASNLALLQAQLNDTNAKLQATELNLNSANLKLEQSTTAAPTEKIIEKIVEIEKIIEVPIQVIKEVEKIVEVPSASDKKRISELESELHILKAAPSTKANTQSENNATNTLSDTDATNITSAANVTPKVDDLLVIEGIGPKVNELFAAKGVTTYTQLAAMNGSEVAAVLETGGSRFQMLNGNSWPKQAALLRDGKMEEFNSYTDYLIAGVDPVEVKAKAADVTPDDLKIVEGIGPKIEQLLNADGVFTFVQLANSNYENLKTILDNAGPRYQMHDPSTWPNQAALARDGKMEELKVLQDNLKGGRK